jgi:hypothetical protein
MINPAAPGRQQPQGRDIVLPTRLTRRESCGCGAGTEFLP